MPIKHIEPKGFTDYANYGYLNDIFEKESAPNPNVQAEEQVIARILNCILDPARNVLMGVERHSCFKGNEVFYKQGEKMVTFANKPDSETISAPVHIGDIALTDLFGDRIVIMLALQKVEAEFNVKIEHLPEGMTIKNIYKEIVRQRN